MSAFGGKADIAQCPLFPRSVPKAQISPASDEKFAESSKGVLAGAIDDSPSSA
jgi:hypothetical protein